MKSYFITSTGTDIGKTYVTELLCKALKARNNSVQALKPIISGWDDDDDATDTMRLMRCCGEASVDEVSPFRYSAPLSPDMAARAEGKEISFEAVLDFCQRPHSNDYQLIEGVGGVMVPLTHDRTILNLMAALKTPVILVVGSYLGSISHTLSAIAVLESANIPISSVVISQSEESVDIAELELTLRNFTKLAIVSLPRLEGQSLDDTELTTILGE